MRSLAMHETFLNWLFSTSVPFLLSVDLGCTLFSGLAWDGTDVNKQSKLRHNGPAESQGAGR